MKSYTIPKVKRFTFVDAYDYTPHSSFRPARFVAHDYGEWCRYNEHEASLTAANQEIHRLNSKLVEKRKVFKKAAVKAMSHRKNNERKLELKIKELEKVNLKLQQENSLVRHRSCGQKVTYNGKMAKLWEAKRGQRAYKCKFCNGWHLSTK